MSESPGGMTARALFVVTVLTFAPFSSGGTHLMRVAVFILAFVFCAVPRGIAQQGGPQFGGGGPANYNGYGFVECTAANTPVVRLVLLQGVVPAALPATAPRPSLALVLTGSPDSIAGKDILLSKDPAGPGQVVSCPVVGSCVPAEK